MSQIFTNDDITMIQNTHINANKTIEDRSLLFEGQALEWYTRSILDSKADIIWQMQDEIRRSPTSSSFTVDIITFYSYASDYERPDMNLSKPLFGDEITGYVNMYHIWRHTNFETKLMYRLGLNAEHYTLKLESLIDSNYDEKNKYYNQIVLIYTP